MPIVKLFLLAEIVGLSFIFSLSAMVASKISLNRSSFSTSGKQAVSRNLKHQTFNEKDPITQLSRSSNDSISLYMPYSQYYLALLTHEAFPLLCLISCSLRAPERVRLSTLLATDRAMPASAKSHFRAPVLPPPPFILASL